MIVTHCAVPNPGKIESKDHKSHPGQPSRHVDVKAIHPNPMNQARIQDQNARKTAAVVRRILDLLAEPPEA